MQATPTTTNPAWDDAMDAASWGQTPACVPVVLNGEVCIYTAALKLPEAVDEYDALAHAIFVCRQARRQAEAFGAHALD